MKRILSLLLLIPILAGCSAGDGAMETAMALRQKIQSGCAFDATVTADYSLTTQTFSLSCQADEAGQVTFCVTEPEEIAGITGKMSDGCGSLTFDDQCVQFDLLAEGLLSPIGGTWVLVHTLRSGYLRSGQEKNGESVISLDDSYDENALRLNITLNQDGLPVFGEILWNQRRILSMEIKNFRFL